MRLFVAVDLDDAARQAAGRAAQRCARALDAAGVPVRWMPHAGLHFTLRFLGEVDPPAVSAARAALAGPWRLPAFHASLESLDLFPYSGATRVIWVGMGEGAAELSQVKTELDRRLEAAGFPRETKPFRPHLTLGRVRRKPEGRSADARPLLADRRVEPVRWEIDRVVLYESRVSYRGSAYHQVDAARLAPAGSGKRGPS